MKQPYQPNQSIMDGVTVLASLAGSREPVSCRELAARLGMETTRVNRMLKTLAFMGMAYQTDARRYMAGPGVQVLAAQSLFGSHLLQAFMRRAAELTALGYTVALGMVWRDQVAFLFHWMPGKTIEDAIGGMAVHDATRSGLGLAILARQTEEDVRALYEGRPVPGFADVDALLSELARTRARGYSLLPERDRRVNIGVTLGEPVYAGLAMAGDFTPEEARAHAERLSRVAAEISKER